MAPGLLLGVLRVLPVLVESGIAIKGLVEETTGKASAPADRVEQYALQALKVLPQLIDAGQDVAGILKATNDAVGLMVREKREPTVGEWDAQARRISALEARLNA